VAFSGEASVDKVDLSVDGGASWQPAKLEGQSTPYGFRLFRHPWKAAPGSYQVLCRATDSTGATQPESPVWNPGGYLNNAMDRVRIEVRS
jgi:hypothetical protein